MPQIHQLVHTLSYGDAISGEVLALQRVLQQCGHESNIYALNVNPRYKGEALALDQFPQDFSGTVILHYSLGSPLNALYLSLSGATRALIYHNITPPKWFASVNPRVMSDIEQGLHELPQLLSATHRILADSEFNAGEIRALGFAAEVLELPVDPTRWEIDANPGIASLLRSDGCTHIVHVGRLAPNKCIEDILKSFFFFHQYLEKKSKLWLVGIDIDTEIYSFALKRLAVQLRLEEAVQFVGCMADSEVRALYENAHLYVCMSEHEGFCLPVVEAMRFGLPVLAYNSSALPQTVGAGGVLVDNKEHSYIAELMLELCKNQQLRAKLIAAGKERVDALSIDRFTERVRALFSVGKA